MKPAFSVISFTTVAGAGQGLVVALACATLAGVPMAATFLPLGLGVALVLLGAGLAASFFHLGHPERAWRAMAMWRTSWLSREVIALPLFMTLVFAWAVLGFITVWILIGFAILLANSIWLIYRVVRGFLAWNDGKAMPV